MTKMFPYHQLYDIYAKVFVDHRAQTYTCFGQPFKDQRIRSIHDEVYLGLHKEKKE